MAAFLRKYGTGTGADVYIPIPKRGVVDFAVSADWTPASGDVKVSKDGGAAANIGTLPTAVTMGNTAMWKFVFTDAELQCAYLAVTIADSATKAVEDQMFVIETYGNASALHAFDLDTATQSVNVSQISGDSTAADTLELFVEALDQSTGQIDSGSLATGAITAASIAADAITDAKVASDVTIASVTGSVGSVTGAVGSVTGNVGGNVAGSVGSIATGGIAAASFANNSITAAALATDAVTEIQSGLATSAEVTGLNVNTRANVVVPVEIETPDASTQVYKIRLFLFDVQGNMEAPDSTPTIALVNAAGTDRSSRLSSASNPSTGVYSWDYTATAGDAEEQLNWTFTVVEGGLTRVYPAVSYVVEETAYRFTSSDRATLNAAATAAALATAQADLDILTGMDGATLATSQPNYAPLRPTVANRTLDVTATGAAGIDWGNVENQSTTVGLTGTTVQFLGNLGYVDDYVYVDEVNGSAGTTVGVNGTLSNPASTFANAYTIATSRGRKNIRLLSDVTMGGGSFTALKVDLNGFLLSTNGSTFDSSLSMFSSRPGARVFNTIMDAFALDQAASYADLAFQIAVSVDAYAYIARCAFIDSTTLTLTGTGAGGATVFEDCYARDIDGLTVNMGSGGSRQHHVIFQGWWGGMTVTNMVANQILHVHGWGKLTIDSSCTGGTIQHGSHVEIVDNASGAVTLDFISEPGTLTAAYDAAKTAASQTSVNTLLTRIPAALFSGITSLAQWLGAMAGKQTPNSTALTEINATGAGSGTFTGTTDSLEAQRDEFTSAAYLNRAADHARRRTQANVEASSDGDALSLGSLYGAIQQMQESSASGTTLTVNRTDGSTLLGTKTLTVDAAADPVTGVS